MIRLTGRYRNEIDSDQLVNLYENSGWVSYTKDMNKLKRALANSLYVVTAWHDDRLIGLARAVGDGETILYIQDVVVHTDYRRHRIGTGLIEKIIKEYPDIRQKALLAEDNDDIRSFYEEIGFMACDQGNMVGFVRFD